MAQKQGQGATQQAKVRRPVLWYANLLHAHGVSQEASLVVSDPGNKKEVAGVKMPDPGQQVCSGGGGRGVRNKEVLFSPDPPAPPQPHTSLPLSWAAEALSRAALPARPT